MQSTRTSWWSSGPGSTSCFWSLPQNLLDEEVEERVVGRELQPLALEKLLCVQFNPEPDKVEGVDGGSKARAFSTMDVKSSDSSRQSCDNLSDRVRLGSVWSNGKSLLKTVGLKAERLSEFMLSLVLGLDELAVDGLGRDHLGLAFVAPFALGLTFGRESSGGAEILSQEPEALRDTSDISSAGATSWF